MSLRGPAAILVSLFVCSSAHAETDGGLPRRDVAAELDDAETRASQGRVIEALRSAHAVLSALGEGARAPEEAARARALVAALLAKVAHVTFTVSPDDATDVEVEFDYRRVDPERLLTGRFSVDPGEHEVHARGFSRLGQRLEAHQKLVLAVGETATVAIALADRGSACGGDGGDGGDMLCLTEAQTSCLKAVRTEAEAAKCISARGVAQRPGCHGCIVGRRADAGEAGVLAFAAATALLASRSRGRRRRVAGLRTERRGPRGHPFPSIASNPAGPDAIHRPRKLGSSRDRV